MASYQRFGQSDPEFLQNPEHQNQQQTPAQPQHQPQQTYPQMQPTHFVQPQMIPFQSQPNILHNHQGPNVMEGQGYQLHKAKQAVSRWGCLVKSFSIFFIITTVLGMIHDIGGIIWISHHSTINVEGPNHKEQLQLSMAPIMLEKLFKIFGKVLVVYQCMLAIRAVKRQSRGESWTLVKKSIVIAVIQMMLIFAMYLCIMVAFGEVIGQWMEKERDMGDYKFSHSNGMTRTVEYKREHKVHHGKSKYHKTHKSTASAGSVDPTNMKQGEASIAEKNEEVFGLQVAVIFSMITAGFCFACLCVCCCASFIAGSYYKFHLTLKNLEEVQIHVPVVGPQPVQAVYVAQQQQMPQQNYQADVNRGQVVGGLSIN